MARHLDRRQRRWAWGLSVGGVSLALPLALLTTVGVINEMRLVNAHGRTCAEVTAAREVRGRRHEYQVRYRFGPDRRYSHSDETGRRDLWSEVVSSQWDQMQRRGCVDIVYVAEDPWINRPAQSSALNHPIGNKAGGFVLVLLILGLFGAAVLGILRTARTRVWRLISAEGDTWMLADDAETRRISPAMIKRATLLWLPPAKIHPPWRFASDVLQLRLNDGNWVTCAVDSPLARNVVASLERERRLKRKRAS